MKILSVFILLLPLLAFKSVDDKAQTVSTPTIGGKEVYIVHMPQAKYKTLGVVRLDDMFDANERMEKLLELAKEKFGDDFDAITTRDGRTANCIKFTETSSGKANYMRASKNQVYILSSPDKKFEILTSEPLEEDYTKLPFHRLLSMLSNKVDMQEGCDAVVLTKDNLVQYIKY